MEKEINTDIRKDNPKTKIDTNIKRDNLQIKIDININRRNKPKTKANMGARNFTNLFFLFISFF